MPHFMYNHSTGESYMIHTPDRTPESQEMHDALSEVIKQNDLLTAGYKQLAQQYHNLSNMITLDRHCSKTYENCDEQSCIIHKSFLNDILLGDK